MRKQMTPAEKLLWFELSKQRLDGAHFRRQALIGPFIVDFANHGAMLVVELDSGPGVALYSDERSRWLESGGYKIMRFLTAQVMEDAAAVAEQILIQTRARMRVIAMMREFDPFEARRVETVN